MKIIITRHGETLFNVQQICQGQTPGELTEIGLLQAKKLAKRFSKEKIDFVYSSDLKRAVDTSKEILKFHPDLELKTDKRIRERYLAEYEGKPFPNDWDWKRISNNVESDEEIDLRVNNFLQEVLANNKGKNLLIVCHGGTLISFLRILAKKSGDDIGSFKDIKNTSVSELVIDENGIYRFEKINCISHLN